MKVLFLPYFPRNPYQPNLAKGLAACGYEVEGLEKVSPLALFNSIRGKKIYHLHWTHLYMLSNSLLISVFKSFLFLLYLTFIKLRGKRLIWTIHNLGGHEKRHPKFELSAHRLLARLCDGIITHNRYAMEQVAELYSLQNHQKKLHIIPHGNYIGNYPDDMPRDKAREPLAITPDMSVFLFLGQIRQYKGVPELISAFAGIESGNEVLIVAGRPYDEEADEELKKLVEHRDSIHYMPGFVPDEKVQEYMKAADVVVFPFRDILTSGSILLAMSFGKAIIVPQLDSLQDIIDVGGAITFSPEQTDGLEQAIQEALKADLEKLGQRNLEAAKSLSWEIIAEKTARLYDSS